MEELNVFRIRAYAYSELASLYSPEISVQAAAKRLSRWFEQHPSLRAELEKLGWQKSDRLLTPMQVKVITSHLGEP